MYCRACQRPSTSCVIGVSGCQALMHQGKYNLIPRGDNTMLMKKKTKGLTLIEWLIVIAIIGIVIFAFMKFNEDGNGNGNGSEGAEESTEIPMMQQPGEEGT